MGGEEGRFKGEGEKEGRRGAGEGRSGIQDRRGEG